jgi:FAD/FMN-containing dehydrogenase
MSLARLAPRRDGAPRAAADLGAPMSFSPRGRLSGMTIERDLHRTFRGPVYLPGDQAYNAARATWGGALDQRPAVVAEAMTARDVQAAVVAAREHGLPFAVQATGHGTHVAADGALLLKTSLMAEVLVDPDRRIARVGPGARMGDIVAAAAPFGLAPIAGSNPTVGVAGYTLGGGFGWLSRRHGFAADSLLRADVVTAEGERLTATAGRHADLFWALRGGGGSLGVVTGLEIALHAVPVVYSGTVEFARERAADVLGFYREWEQPDALSTSLVLAGDTLTLRVMYAGDAEDAERALQPLRYVAGPAARQDLRASRYADAATPGTAPRHFHLFERLGDAVIAAVVDSPANAVEIRRWGGAMAAAGPDAGPAGHRQVPFSVTVDGSPEAAAPLAPHATGGTFLNFLHDTTRTRAAYTPADYARLRDVKRAYDPDNVLARGHAIAPAATAHRRAA